MLLFTIILSYGCITEQARMVYAREDMHIGFGEVTALIRKGVMLESIPGSEGLVVSVRLWTNGNGNLYIRENAEFSVGKLLETGHEVKEGYLQFSSVTDASHVAASRREALKKLDDLYIERCGTCHRAFEPHMFDSKHWEQVMGSMKVQAGISDEEYENILYFLNISLTEDAG